MDIVSTTVQLDTPDGKMEAYEARPKGDSGSYVPVEQIHKALTDNGVNFDLKTYPEATHGFFCNECESSHADYAKDAWENFKDFFQQHVK
jgi:dienelactone hydrolase